MPSYNDSGLTNGQTVYYTVVAVDNTGEGANSAQQSATPAAVTLSASAQLRTRVHVGASGVVIVRASGALRIQIHLAPRATLVQLTGAVLRTRLHFGATTALPGISPHAALSITTGLQSSSRQVLVIAAGALRVQSRLRATPTLVQQATATLGLHSQLQVAYGIDDVVTGWSIGRWDNEEWNSPFYPMSNLGISSHLAARGLVINQAAAQLGLRWHLTAGSVLVLPAAASLTDRTQLRGTSVVIKRAIGSLADRTYLQGTGLGIASASATLVMQASLQGFQGVNSQPAIARINIRAQLSGAGLAIQGAGTAALSVQASLVSAQPLKIQVASGASLRVRARLASSVPLRVQVAGASLTVRGHLGATALVSLAAAAAETSQFHLAGNAVIRRDASGRLGVQTQITATATTVLAMTSARVSTVATLSGSATVVKTTAASLVCHISLEAIASGPLISPANALIMDNFYVEATATYVVVASALLETTFRIMGPPSGPIVVLNDSAGLVMAAHLAASGIPTGAVQGATFAVSVEETNVLTTMVRSP